MKSRLQNRLYKKQYIGALILAFLILGGTFLAKIITDNSPKNLPPHLEFSSMDTNAIQINIIQNFNPNLLESKDWLQLGFTERQVKTILKYKEIVGGNFVSKQQLKKCYAISDAKFAQLAPYILLPENNPIHYQQNFGNYTKKELQIKAPFNPDHYSQKDWENLGFSEKQAAGIMKYKQYLGGSFVSKEKLRDCYMINDNNYQKLAPYLLLPEKGDIPQKSYTNEKPKINYKPFDPNYLDEMGWLKLGFSEKQVAGIFNYKNKILKGYFKNKDDLQRCYMISPEKFAEMEPYIHITTDVTPKNIIEKTPENPTDFSKIDLNKITFAQLKEFGFTEKNAAGILAYRKKLGGYVAKNQLLEVYDIDQNLASGLIKTCPLEKIEIKKYTLVTAPENWLKEHPYFKYYADKIIYYRTSFPDDKKILKMLKLKPETENKMKLYLEK